MKFFPCQGKVWEFCGWPGKFRKDLESQGKGNLKINGYGRQTSKNLFILFKRGKDVLFHEVVQAHIPLLGATPKGKNWGANSFLEE